MRRVAAAVVSLFILGGSAVAGPCPGNPNALGVSRVITLGPTEYPRVGLLQYPQTLPLNDHEVVLTFDDGPLPPYTTRVLDFLASECVKANYFIVGRQANEYPDIVRQIYVAGHTVGTHTQNHPLTLNVMALDRAEQEINDGITSVAAALGNPKAVAPYLRIPGLLRSNPVEDYLASRQIMIWSIDADADDWTGISPDEIVRRLMARLNKRGKGILLLHDIHPNTVLALPKLFAELKAQGYKLVHVVPPGERPLVLPDSIPMTAVPLSKLHRTRHATTTVGSPAFQDWSEPPPQEKVRGRHHRHLTHTAEDTRSGRYYYRPAW